MPKRPKNTPAPSLFEEYDERVASGAYLAAIVKLGELLKWDKSAQYKSHIRRLELEHQIRTHVDPDVLRNAQTKAVDARKQAIKILSFGTKFTWDELVLILTLRIQLELASAVMALWDVEPSFFDLPGLDSEIREVAMCRVNRRAFASALQTIRKNWYANIEDVWTRPSSQA